MRPTLELSMIVNDGSNGLERCLESAVGCVDRILIGDTGKGNVTREIASRYGAELIPVPWNDDFAEARNQVLAQAACDWILLLDADEMLDDAALAILPALLSDQAVWAYDVWRWNYVEDCGHRSAGEHARANPGRLDQARSYPAYFQTDHTRLFRRDPRIRFQHCVHESVVDSLESAQLQRGRASFVIHHFGYTDDATGGRSRKDDLYYRLSLKKLIATPESWQAQLEMGIGELDYSKRPTAALEYLTTATSLDPSKYVAWLYRGICLTRMARYEEALHDLEKAAALAGPNVLVHSALGDVHFQTADYAEAHAAYEYARRLGDGSPLTYAKLGAVEVQLGMGAKGLAKIIEAVEKNPTQPELLDILSTTALLAGETATACNAACRRIALQGAMDFHFILAATLHTHAGELRKAKLILYIASQLYPHNEEISAMFAAC